MTKRIIFQNDEGGVSIIVPAESVEAAMKDIPEGKPYKIGDAADIPTDRTFRSAWEIDPATLTDGIGAESNEFPQEVTA